MASRRRLVAALAAGLGAGLAGCVDGGGSGSYGGDESSGADGDGGDSPSDDDSNGTDADDGAVENGTDDAAIPFETDAFDDGESIPTEYTCDGADVSPPLTVGDVPDEASSLAVVVDDPDAPNGTFTHWTVWNLPPSLERIPKDVPPDPRPADLDGARQGENDFGEIGYRGPCPPEEDGSHEYRFTLYALESDPELEAGASVDAVRDALEGATVAEARFAGTYGR